MPKSGIDIGWLSCPSTKYGFRLYILVSNNPCTRICWPIFYWLSLTWTEVWWYKSRSARFIVTLNGSCKLSVVSFVIGLSILIDPYQLYSWLGVNCQNEDAIILKRFVIRQCNLGRKGEIECVSESRMGSIFPVLVYTWVDWLTYDVFFFWRFCHLADCI